MRHFPFFKGEKMDKKLHKEAEDIIRYCIEEVMPDRAVKKALKDITLRGKVVLVSVGKAAYQMAKVADDCLKDRINDGIVITKYHHIKSKIAAYDMIEAGHPVPDENSFKGTEKALEKVRALSENDTVLFLLSGGGSALFENPKCSKEQLERITNDLLSSGADIVEINTIRKRLSNVKGGRFALATKAHIYQIVLSDILGDPLDMIASGPCTPDSSTNDDAKAVIKKYNIKIDDDIKKCFDEETPKSLTNVTSAITGSVRELCKAAEEKTRSLGYKPFILTDMLSIEAREAGVLLSDIIKTYRNTTESLAFILGGETVVHLKGKGKGGRNQEIALSSSRGISGIKGAAVISVGSDGTDGPTDAAGGYADYESMGDYKALGINVDEYLDNNDAYNALSKIDALVITGPTGTNVNDVTLALIKR